MATHKTISHRFSHGSPVRIEPRHYSKYGIEFGDVVAVTRIDSNARSKIHDRPIGTFVYLVEGPTGKAVAIPEDALSLDEA